MIEGFAFIRAFKDADLEPLVAGAAEDQHIVLPVTSVVEKNGEVVGYFHTSPSTVGWLSTKRLTARDTFHLLNTHENLLGASVLQWPVPTKSPMWEQMPRLGYKNMGDFTLFMRGVQ